MKSVDNSKELVCIGAGGKVAYGESSHFGLTLVLGVSCGKVLRSIHCFKFHVLVLWGRG